MTHELHKLATIAAAIVLAVTLLVPATARADCDESQNESSAKGKKNYRTIVGPDGKKTFVIEKAFVVCGKVPKPTVIYVLQASTINYEWENLKQDFLPKILKSVKDKPF
jgi:hypothetical protein